MKTIEIAAATESLAVYAREAKDEPLLVTENGTPTAVLLPLENSDVESVSLSTNKAFIALIERSRARARIEGGISPAEMRRRLENSP